MHIDLYVAQATPALDGCLIWWGSPSSPKAWAGGKVGYLPRRVLEAKLGRKLKKGEVTRHICDVARCVNKDHLEVGSQAQNIRDSWARGRARNGTRKLPEYIRKEIKARYEFGGISRAKLGAEYGITKASVRYISKAVFHA